MKIASVFVPRFSVEAERQRSPAVASRLVLIGDSTVLDCSLGADSSGVKRGMRMSEAIGLCPKAVVISPDLPYYQRCFKEMLDFLQEQSPDIEAGEPGHAYMDAGGFEVAPARGQSQGGTPGRIGAGQGGAYAGGGPGDEDPGRVCAERRHAAAVPAGRRAYLPTSPSLRARRIRASAMRSRSS